jgi:hypothetical protein
MRFELKSYYADGKKIHFEAPFGVSLGVGIGMNFELKLLCTWGK